MLPGSTAAPLTLRPLQRKKTLLVEYKQLKKANAFVDRRIGGALKLLCIPGTSSCIML